MRKVSDLMHYSMGSAIARSISEHKYTRFLVNGKDDQPQPHQDNLTQVDAAEKVRFHGNMTSLSNFFCGVLVDRHQIFTRHRSATALRPAGERKGYNIPVAVLI
jgi:hypothetical protein